MLPIHEPISLFCRGHSVPCIHLAYLTAHPFFGALYEAMAGKEKRRKTADEEQGVSPIWEIAKHLTDLLCSTSSVS
jgi:hypothetical protein